MHLKDTSVLVLLLFVSALLYPTVAHGQTPTTKRILILNSYGPNLPGSIAINQTMRDTIRGNSGGRVEFYYEFQDNARIPNEKYEAEMVAFLKRKYAGEDLDLIIGFGSPALDFLLRHDAELFTGVAKLYYFHDELASKVQSLWPRVTGVWTTVDLTRTLDVALAVHPDTQRVVVVSGDSVQDRFFSKQAQEEFRKYEGKIEFNYTADLTIEELKNQLAALPPRTVVLYLSFFLDKNGNTYTGPEALAMFAQSSSAPIYGISQTYIGYGVVGGSLIDFPVIGTRLGELTLRVLNGENPRDIPPQNVPNVSMFDWRQLRRWRIDESKLPAGSIVEFKQPTIWQEYKWYAIAAFAAFMVQSVLVVLLLQSRVRRSKAEHEGEQLAGLVRAKHRHLNEVVSNVPGVVWETRTEPSSKQRRTTFVSDYMQKMLGYTPEEWLKQPPGFGLRIMAEEDRERVARESDAVVETGIEGVSEFRWYTKDGRIRWIENYLSPIVEENKGIVGLRGVALDVTDRKLAVDELRQSEQRFSKAFRANPQPMSLTTIAEGRYLDVNNSFLAMSGYTREEVIGHTSLELGTWETPEQRTDFVNQVLETGSVVNVETKFRTKNGDLRLLLSSAERLEIGGEDCLLIASSDVTERMAAQKALAESEARFRNMADTAPVMIWVADEKQASTYVNKQGLDFTGRTPEQEMGFGWAESIHPDDVEQVVALYSAAFQQRTRVELEFRLRRADGEYRWVLSSGTPRFSMEGEFLGYIGSCVDITERKQSEQELRTAHDQLEELKNQLEAENIYLQEQLQEGQAFGDIVGQSAAIKYVIHKVSQVAPIDSTVLLTGETGTGKELIARAIHSASPRKDRPLIKVNCAALAPGLIESELFGHEKGAFTGAAARKLGRFELANTGTILLDEIGELPLDLQSRLLRVLQEGEFERVGSAKTIKVDVRIIAATNRDLKTEVEKGKFREDLWYRLNVFPITTPPLRERRDDIPILIDHFARRFARKFGKQITAVAPDSQAELCSYSWPGNIRELANVIERAVINARGPVLRIRDDFAAQEAEILAASVKTLDEMEREHIVRVLEDLHWRIEGPRGAARILGINPSTLRTRMVKLGIQKPGERLVTSAK